MKKPAKTPIIKLSEKFDKQLLRMLSEELKAIREAKNQMVKNLNNSGDGLLVA